MGQGTGGHGHRGPWAQGGIQCCGPQTARGSQRAQRHIGAMRCACIHACYSWQDKSHSQLPAPSSQLPASPAHLPPPLLPAPAAPLQACACWWRRSAPCRSWRPGAAPSQPTTAPSSAGCPLCRAMRHVHPSTSPRRPCRYNRQGRGRQGWGVRSRLAAHHAEPRTQVPVLCRL